MLIFYNKGDQNKDKYGIIIAQKILSIVFPNYEEYESSQEHTTPKNQSIL